MADLKLTSGLPATRPASTPTPAVRAAQRAFFDAALKGVAPTAPTARSMGGEVRAAAAQPRTAASAETPRPERLMRPGSFLDIKV